MNQSSRLSGNNSGGSKHNNTTYEPVDGDPNMSSNINGSTNSGCDDTIHQDKYPDLREVLSSFKYKIKQNQSPNNTPKINLSSVRVCHTHVSEATKSTKNISNKNNKKNKQNNISKSYKSTLCVCPMLVNIE